jgi:predicted dehydrogenase
MKILIIGMGSAGQRHARVVRNQYPNSEIHFFRGKHRMGLISPDLKSINNLQDPADYYALNEILDISNIKGVYDLIIIATPANSHYHYYSLLRNRSIKMLIEKPLSNNLIHSENIFADALKRNLKILVGYQHFYNPIFQMVRLNMDRINKVSSISMQYLEPLSYMNAFRDMSNHHLNSHSGGGAILALSHEIDFLLSLFPESFGKVSAKQYTLNRDSYILDSCKIYSEPLRMLRPHINLELSFAIGTHRRSGTITSNQSRLEWDIIKKEILIRKSGTERKIHFDYSSDDLIRYQLVEFIEDKISDNELMIRFNRARMIIFMSSDNGSKLSF